ncbi:MAG: PA14 domain protein [Chloroflexi bacterium ADurb.Bin360]|nr:MAG: PA14 domain protein [Chloroflexi bacterium ADurb.Bin360]
MAAKRVLQVALLLAVVLVGGPVLAQGPVLPMHSDPTWSAAYWNNMSLTGAPAFSRQEPNLDYDWGAGSPAPDVINPDQFSARWTRYIDVTPGNYRFTVTSDDGIRLWLDSVLVLDKWYDHAVQTFTVDRYLGTGHHYIVVEYYENGSLAVARLGWALLDSTGTGWRGEYFNNKSLSGTPALVRTDTALNFNWGTISPAPGTIGVDNFSVRWTQTTSIAAGMTRFNLTSDDGARLWVNGHLLIDAWRDQAATTYQGDIYLPGGPVAIELQYYENSGNAVAQLNWAPASGGSPDAIIVDDKDPGFVRGGSPTGWRSVNEGHNGRLYWTYNNDKIRPNYNWARWYPTLAGGRYEVFVYIPDRYTTTANARYWVVASGQYTLKIVDQSAYDGGQWVSLGIYNFSGGGSEYVSLADVTYETRLSRLVGFDAVKWERR